MFILKGKKARTLSTAIALLTLSSATIAGTVQYKPGDQNLYAPEFGSALARDGNYTAIGAMQETAAIPGEAIFGNGFLGSQGVVRLFNGSTTTPERIYQFTGNNHLYKKLGAKIAMSSKWLVLLAMDHDFRVNNIPSVIYIIGKTNNQWTQCPTVNSVVDCTSLVSDLGVSPSQPIIRIPLTERHEIKDISIAVSDDYLVIGDNKNSKFTIYKYNATTNSWVVEHTETSLPERRLGTAVAIEGDKVAVSSPFFREGDTTPGIEKGTVRVYKRNTNGTWYVSGNNYGYYTEGNFGRTLDMHSGNLVVSSGQLTSQPQLTFFRVDSSGSLSAPYTIPTTIDYRNHLSVYGDTAVNASGTSAKSAIIYKRNPVNDTWSEVNSLDGELYKSQNTSGYAFNAVDPVKLVGDDLILGWRGVNGNQGAVIHEKVSLIDNCKSPLNLVSNCAFDNASGTGWQFLNHQGASASVNYSGSQLNAVIYYGSNVHWHIQARTAVSLATSGTYQLRFRAKADTYRSITVNLGHNGNQDSNWASYGQTTFTPGPEWSEFTFEFNGIPADTNAFLDFNLGNAGTTGVSIDGVKLSKKN